MEMHTALLARPLAPLLCLALVLGPLPVRAEQTIHCGGSTYRYRYCPVDTGDRAQMVHQYSMIGCRQNESWGYDRNGVWVDHGCEADFRVGNDNRNRDKVMAGAALVGLAALIAMSASKQKQEQAQAQGEVEAWSVGSFTGYDETERAQVQLTILPGGSVSGHAGRNDFTGSLRENRLEAGRHRFRVERSGNGFTAVDERDAGHRVVFQRSGSGY
jgi:hypothetical protein